MTKLYKFYLRLLHPKENSSYGRTRQKAVVLIFLAPMVFFFEKKYFSLRKVSGQSILRKLFILRKKSRVCLKDPPPPKLKASF
jgi:hypothetical protein